MAAFSLSSELYDEVSCHLQGRIEQVGFFRATFDAETRTFNLYEWCAIPPEGFEYQGAYHVSLTDEARAEAIKWAWDARACLVEAHSHSDPGPAEFSPSDLWGFRDWVPHLFWRLRQRPYGALVTAGDSFDALAWLEAPDRPESVERIELDDGSVLVATGRTLAGVRENDREQELGAA